MRKLKVIHKLHQESSEQHQSEIISGLNSTPKFISPKFLYDAKGSELFEAITYLEEYYPTKSELTILSSIGEKLDVEFTNLNIIEFGSGDHSKIKLLMQQIPSNDLKSLSYFPVDISESAIRKSAENLFSDLSLSSITGIVADFMHQFIEIPRQGKRLFCFLGSTIGNLNPDEAKEFLRLVSSEMNIGDHFLLGLDMVKDIEVLESAYNDKLGVTAKFNRNILNVVNRKIDSDFDATQFEHVAFYNEAKSRIEMHLKAMQDISVMIKSNSKIIDIKKNEMIHTENSYKFNESDIKLFGKYGGLKVLNVFRDEKKYFSLAQYLKG